MKQKKKVKMQSKKVKEKCIIVKKNRYLHVIYYIKREKLCKKCEKKHEKEEVNVHPLR